MNGFKLQAWNSFKEIIAKFLGNIKDPQYELKVKFMLQMLQTLVCNKSFKFVFSIPVLYILQKIQLGTGREIT